jgi:hypothetical protein
VQVKIECLDPLLNALNDGTFLNADLEGVAISKAFRKASVYQDDRTLLVKPYFDHPEISAKNYSDALYYSNRKGDKAKELFYWLLARADRLDLEAVKDDEGFSRNKPEFQSAVTQALEAVGPNARPRITQRGITTTVTALEKAGIPEVLILLTLEYSEWQAFDPDVRLGLNHRKVVKKAREALSDVIPDDPFSIIAEYI